MSTTRSLLRLLLCVPALLAACATPTSPVPRLARRFVLPGVTGRIDHLAHDAVTDRLFVACKGNGSIEVIDLPAGVTVGTIRGVAEPQGIAVVPATRSGTSRVFVACGGDGNVRAYDATTLIGTGTVLAGDDADNVRMDPRTGWLHVGCGTDAGGAIVAIDPRSFAVMKRTPLPGHAEGFQLDPDGPRLFVNVPGGKTADADGEVVVADREHGTVAVTWQLHSAARNFPLAFVPEHKLVLVACRKPSVLVALDSTTGNEIARTACCDDADDLFFDAPRQRVLLLGGGALDVLELPADGRMRAVATVPLPPGSRTGLLVPARRALYVAAPAHDGAAAEILEFVVD